MFMGGARIKIWVKVRLKIRGERKFTRRNLQDIPIFLNLVTPLLHPGIRRKIGILNPLFSGGAVHVMSHQHHYHSGVLN